jgi:two-component system, OmpR family, alkaline phosphatase synthesis response regulator PhoP
MNLNEHIYRILQLEMQKILIVEDDLDILEMLGYNLEEANYQVKTATNGKEAIMAAKDFKPDLILLDYMMPYMNGLEVCNILRAYNEFNDTKIIFLTAMNDDLIEIAGLEAGANDYLVKPIKPGLLLTRIKTHLRKLSPAEIDSMATIKFGDLEINRAEFIIKLNGVSINFARKEFELLHLLASKPGRVFQRNEILNEIWGNEVIVGDRTIDVHIRKIRQKLDDKYIFTIKGVGYKFEA